MSLEEDILIEQFLKGNLSKSEVEDFLKKIENDVEFKAQVSFEKQLKDSLSEEEWSFMKNKTPEVEAYNEIYKSKEIQKLKNVIQDSNNVYQQPKKTISRKWFLYASAAVIALLVSIYVFKPSASPQELYLAYIDNSVLPSYISREDSGENNLIRAQQFFENKKYEKALDIFEKELKNSSTPDAAIYLYKGIAHMELDEFEEAEKTFDTLIDSDLIDASKGKWYKALLYLKMEDVEKSKTLLNEIVQDATFNHKIAKKLLQQLPSK